MPATQIIREGDQIHLHFEGLARWAKYMAIATTVIAVELLALVLLLTFGG